jgi:hypothetical protein
MADNVTLPGTGEVVATDDIGTRQYQRIKLTDGLADSEVHARVKDTNADAHDAGMVVRLTPQDTWSVSFTRVNGSALDSPEMTLRRQGTGVTVSQAASNLLVGAGTTANAEFLARSTITFNGALIERHQTVLSQRIANNNFAVLLADRIGEGLSCTINSTTSISVTLTAHGFTAANVGQSMFVGAINGANGVPGRYAIASIPDANTINFTVAGWPASGSCTVDLFGWNYIRWLYTGTTVTNANIDAQRYGWNSGDTVATINTTASPGHMAQTAIDGRNVYFSDTLVASSTAPTVTLRGHRVVSIPDDDIELYLYLWSFNGTTNPASGTTWTVGFVAVEDTVNLPVYFAGARPTGTAAPIPVVQTVAGPTQPVSGTVTANAGTGTFAVSLATNTPTLAAGSNLAADFAMQYRASATGAGTPTNINCPATPAVQTIKGSAGRLLGLYLVNTNATIRWLKVYNIVSPTLASSTATLRVPLPQNEPVFINFEGGMAFGTAITCAVTSTASMTDSTGAVTADDVTGFSVHA